MKINEKLIFHVGLGLCFTIAILHEYYQVHHKSNRARADLPGISLISSYRLNGCQYQYVTPGGVQGKPILLDWQACGRLRKVINAPVIELDDLRNRSKLTGERFYPQFVTGLSADVHINGFPGYHKEFSRLFAARFGNWLQAMPPDQKMIIYDLNPIRNDTFFGELAKMTSWDPERVELRWFPFDDYPEHFRALRSYAFKQVVIAEIAAEFGAAMWVDMSMSFQYDSRILPDYLYYDDPVRWRSSVPKSRWSQWKLDSEGCMFYYTVPTWHSNDWGTHPWMYDYLPFEEGRGMRHTRQWQAPHIVYNTQYCQKYFIAPSVACSLNRDCIIPADSAKGCPGYIGWWAGGTRCHRQDQSVVNVLTTNMCGPGWEGCTMQAAEFRLVGLPSHLAVVRRSPDEKSDDVLSRTDAIASHKGLVGR